MKSVFLGILFGIYTNSVFCDSGKCGTKLLNDYDKVPDSAFTATSHFIHPDPLKKKVDFSAKAARESYDKENQEFAWCPRNQVETALSEYLEIDLGRLTIVNVVQTKGRFAQGAGKEFTPLFKIRYSRDFGQIWKDYKKFRDKGFEDILNGPNDAFLDAFETLDPPIVARLVRIFPYSKKSKRVCLKLQLFGCDFESNVMEYEMIQGTPASFESGILSSNSLKYFPDVLYPCLDNAYDGNYYEGRLRDGLGLLTDNFMGKNLTNKSRDFVGWHKESLDQMPEYISVKFKFLNSRNFTSVKIYSYSNSIMQVDFFSQVHILFSDDDVSYNKRLIKTSILPNFAELDFSIYINLSGYSGRFIKINFYFHSQWLLLSEVSFRSEPSRTLNKERIESLINNEKNIRKKSDVITTVKVKHHIVDYQVITTTPPKYIEKAVSLEIIYLLSVLLCMLLGVITAICSFWIIIKRKRTQRKKNIKKQALAICFPSSFIPYNNHSSSLQCLESSFPPVTVPSRGNYPTYSIDRRNYPNGTLRTVSNLTGGYHSHSSVLDQGGMTNKHCNGDTNIYTSIVGSDNDSSLSPEYATTSITNDPILPPGYVETSASYLPPPIEPIRSNGYTDSFRSKGDRKSQYYLHPSALPSPQDSVNLWKMNGNQSNDMELFYNSPNQMSFNDFSYLKYNPANQQDGYGSYSSSKYAEIPCINSHF